MAPTGKWKGKYDSGRKYKKSWEQKFLWLTKSSDGSEHGLCKLCKTQIAPKLSRLSDHEKTKGHTERASASSHSAALPFSQKPKIDKDIEITKRIEIELAVTIACHCATSTVDHLAEFMKKNGEGSKLSNLQVHRTKCSKLISKVISPALKETQQHDVENKKFAILIDESTDIAIDKHLCIVIRYFNQSKLHIVTEFVALKPVVGATGRELFEILRNTLDEFGLKLVDCIGFGSNGGSAVIGEHNSVWSRIREQSPHCQLNRCICHSLALCIEKAFDKLPSNLGYLLAEIPKWFSKSILQREAFSDLFKVMDAMDDRKGTPFPFQKLSAVPWLVRGKVIYNILINWEELKAYFLAVVPTADASCRYKAREILGMLSDPVNALYFHFVSPIVTEFEGVNSFFQATDADPEEMVRELLGHYKRLKGRIIDSEGKALDLDRVDYGAKFTSELRSFVNSQNRSPDALNKEREMKTHCASLLREALSQFEKHLPASMEVFKSLRSLSPSKVLSQTARVPFRDLPMPHLRSANEAVIEEQYRRILLVHWAEESVFDGRIPSDTATFWAGVLQYKSKAGEQLFEQLAMYVLSCLATPTSNAVAEHIFSAVTHVKTKARNRLQTEMLDAIIRIRTHLQFQGKCCTDFSATERMLQLFTSENMYGNQAGQPDHPEDIDEDIMNILY